MSKDDKPITPHGPFTQELKVAILVTKPDDDSNEHQIAEVTWTAPPGTVINEEQVTEACNQALKAVSDQLEGMQAHFLSREQFLRHKMAGSIMAPIAMPGKDEWTLPLENVSTRYFRAELDEDDEL